MLSLASPSLAKPKSWKNFEFLLENVTVSTLYKTHRYRVRVGGLAVDDLAARVQLFTRRSVQR